MEKSNIALKLLVTLSEYEQGLDNLSAGAARGFRYGLKVKVCESRFTNM